MKKTNNAYVTKNEFATFKTELMNSVKVAIADALKGANKPAPARGNEAPTPKKTVATTKSAIMEYEPKKGADGEYIWASYKAKRGDYCYFVATNGDIKDGKVFGTKWYGKVDFSENGKYYKAKAEFEKKFKYVKKADR